MDESWDRRRFLKRVAAGCAGVAGTTAAGLLLSDDGRDQPPGEPEVSQVRDFSDGLRPGDATLVVAGGAPEAATRAAIRSLGGMKSFIKTKDVVAIKPNIGWDRTPVQAANTNPLVVRSLVELCYDAGAARVIVTDNTCNEAKRCFTRSGIWKAAEQAGAEVILPAPHRFRSYHMGGVVLGEMPVLTSAVQVDRFINAPIAKHHGLSGFTGAMKNLYGILGGRRNRLHQRIDDSIADLADFVRPTLTVMDATRVLMRNGPQGGNLDDTREVGKIIASTDQVAVDAYSCGLIGLEPGDLPYLRMAQERGLGNADLANISVREVG